ncbi:hypothetical protein ABPG77_009518 [Micractinium sp. CCAP 211/92]
MQATSSLLGTRLHQQPARIQPRTSRTVAVKPSAIFGKRRSSAVVVEEPPTPPKRTGLGGLFGGRSSSTQQQKPAAPAKMAAPAKKASPAKKVEDKAAEYEKRRSGLSRVIGALDFAEVRSKSDAELLYEAKYGKRGDNGKLTAEQAAALRRRVVGTKKDYWKDWVDVKGEYAEKGYVARDRSSTASSVPALPFLVGVVLALFAATAYVVAATS